MDKWQLHEAKNKLSNIIDTAMHGKPQCITKRGEDAVIIIGINDYEKLIKQKLNFSEFLLSGSKFDDLEIERARGKSREGEL
jgi:prevent-host-death family protein